MKKQEIEKKKQKWKMKKRDKWQKKLYHFWEKPTEIIFGKGKQKQQ